MLSWKCQHLVNNQDKMNANKLIKITIVYINDLQLIVSHWIRVISLFIHIISAVILLKFNWTFPDVVVVFRRNFTLDFKKQNKNESSHEKANQQK